MKNRLSVAMDELVKMKLILKNIEKSKTFKRDDEDMKNLASSIFHVRNACFRREELKKLEGLGIRLNNDLNNRLNRLKSLGSGWDTSGLVCLQELKDENSMVFFILNVLKERDLFKKGKNMEYKNNFYKKLLRLGYDDPFSFANKYWNVFEMMLDEGNCNGKNYDDSGMRKYFYEILKCNDPIWDFLCEQDNENSTNENEYYGMKKFSERLSKVCKTKKGQVLFLEVLNKKVFLEQLIQLAEKKEIKFIDKIKKLRNIYDIFLSEFIEYEEVIHKLNRSNDGGSCINSNLVKDKFIGSFKLPKVAEEIKIKNHSFFWFVEESAENEYCYLLLEFDENENLSESRYYFNEFFQTLEEKLQGLENKLSDLENRLQGLKDKHRDIEKKISELKKSRENPWKWKLFIENPINLKSENIIEYAKNLNAGKENSKFERWIASDGSVTISSSGTKIGKGIMECFCSFSEIKQQDEDVDENKQNSTTNKEIGSSYQKEDSVKNYLNIKKGKQVERKSGKGKAIEYRKDSNVIIKLYQEKVANTKRDFNISSLSEDLEITFEKGGGLLASIFF